MVIVIPGKSERNRNYALNSNTIVSYQHRISYGEVFQNFFAVVDDIDPCEVLKHLKDMFPAKLDADVVTMIFTECGYNVNQALENLMAHNDDNQHSSDTLALENSYPLSKSSCEDFSNNCDTMCLPENSLKSSAVSEFSVVTNTVIENQAQCNHQNFISFSNHNASEISEPASVSQLKDDRFSSKESQEFEIQQPVLEENLKTITLFHDAYFPAASQPEEICPSSSFKSSISLNMNPDAKPFTPMTDSFVFRTSENTYTPEKVFINENFIFNQALENLMAFNDDNQHSSDTLALENSHPLSKSSCEDFSNNCDTMCLPENSLKSSAVSEFSVVTNTVIENQAQCNHQNFISFSNHNASEISEPASVSQLKDDRFSSKESQEFENQQPVLEENLKTITLFHDTYFPAASQPEEICPSSSFKSPISLNLNPDAKPFTPMTDSFVFRTSENTYTPEKVFINENFICEKSDNPSPQTTGTSSPNGTYGLHQTSNEPLPLSEIMDMEYALQLQQKEQMENSKLNESYIAVELKRQKIYEMFPGVYTLAIDDLFEANNYSLDETVFVIEQYFGKPAKVSENPFSSPDLLQSQIKQKHMPDFINQDWNDQIYPDAYTMRENSEIAFNPTISNEAEGLRNEAVAHYHLCNELMSKAHEAHKKGKQKLASCYAQAGNNHKEKSKEADKRASELIIEERNILLDPLVLDLHGLYVKEAIPKLGTFLMWKKQALTNKAYEGSQFVTVITGRGVHSRNGAKLRPSVFKYLEARGYSPPRSHKSTKWPSRGSEFETTGLMLHAIPV